MTMVQQLVRFHELARSDVPGRQRPSRSAVAVRCVSGRLQPCDNHVQHIQPIQRFMAQAAAGVLLPAMLHASAVFPAGAAVELSPSNPLNDQAKIVSSELRPKITKQLQEFEERTGWHLRVFTNYGLDGSPTDADRRSWNLDKRSVVLQFDPSSPNILNLFYVGDEALFKLRRPFWTELQSRFGNMFYVREQGEQAAVVDTLNALTSCLGKEEGCRVVPGLPPDQYNFTLGLSVAAGLILGFVTQLEPQGIVQRKWVWALIFSPLWASTFINFGLGPVVTRTDDIAPVAANTAAFLLTAGAFVLREPLSKALRPPQNPEEGQ